MEIYPAVDLYEGKVVRLEKGDYSKRKTYSADPKAIAQKWLAAGCAWLHVIDLEGARSGEIKNWDSLEKILQAKSSVQFGGGVRREDDIRRLFDLGVKRVILGSKILDRDFLQRVTQKNKKRIALSLDIRGDEVQVEGWLKGSGKSIDDYFLEMKRYPVDCLIVTDIDRDGTLGGMDQKKMRRLLEKSPFPIILSGGVASVQDIQSLANFKNTKLKGVIVGKALYEGKLDLKSVVKLIQGKEN